MQHVAASCGPRRAARRAPRRALESKFGETVVFSKIVLRHALRCRAAPRAAAARPARRTPCRATRRSHMHNAPGQGTTRKHASFAQ